MLSPAFLVCENRIGCSVASRCYGQSMRHTCEEPRNSETLASRCAPPGCREGRQRARACGDTPHKPCKAPQNKGSHPHFQVTRIGCIGSTSWVSNRNCSHKVQLCPPSRVGSTDLSPSALPELPSTSPTSEQSIFDPFFPFKPEEEEANWSRTSCHEAKTGILGSLTGPHNHSDGSEMTSSCSV